MGHTRLGELPKTRKFAAVVAGLIGQPIGAGGAVPPVAADDAERIARLSLDAVQAGLDRCVRDPGLRRTFYVLTQIVLAAREKNWDERLWNVGVELSPEANLWELASEMQRGIDQYLRSSRHGPTDISEIAQQAAGEALTDLAGHETGSLFESGRPELLLALRSLSTKAGFARLGHRFFSRFMARFLNFYLSRATASCVGRERLPTIQAVRDFEGKLDLHCYQSARVVHDYCGDWYSKTEFQEGITQENTNRFLIVAMRKLRREMEKQEAAV